MVLSRQTESSRLRRRSKPRAMTGWRLPRRPLPTYVSRRRRRYRSLTSLDKTFRIPDHLQQEMMMDCASITDHMQQVAALTATKPLTLETMGLALIQQFPLIHERELSRSRDRTHHARRCFPTSWADWSSPSSSTSFWETPSMSCTISIVRAPTCSMEH